MKQIRTVTDLIDRMNRMTEKEVKEFKKEYHRSWNAENGFWSFYWIPCSDGLPEEDGEYLVTDVSGGAATVTETYFITDCDGEGHWGALDVVAWMPLPEPYKDGEQNETD